MGKNEIDRLRQSQLIPCKPINTQHLALYMPPADNDEELILPDNIQPFNNQVAGHTIRGLHFGMMKYNGMVLKPITKNINGARESNFYEELKQCNNDVLKGMLPFTPQYFGKEFVQVDGDMVEFLMLEDLTKGFKEPCVMDIKIGKRTWDPLASYQKVLKENGKYHELKRDLGYCVPGFQVYDLTTGKMQKYGKDYGKLLNKDSIIDAFKIFLNADTALSRNLIVQLLASLWRIQNWARKQDVYRLYSSSILLIYDARRLRQTLETNGTIIKSIKTKPVLLKRSTSLYRPLSLAVLHDSGGMRTGFSGQLDQDGPIFPHSMNARNIDRTPATSKDATTKSVPTLKRMHSFQNNYDKDLQSIRDHYVYMLDDLVTEEKSELWATAKLIDFAHAYPAEDHSIDMNYLDGVQNLVKIFEAFLDETTNRDN